MTQDTVDIVCLFVRFSSSHLSLWGVSKMYKIIHFKCTQLSAIGQIQIYVMMNIIVQFRNLCTDPVWLVLYSSG